MPSATPRAAIVLANNRYQTPNGKTAHGLVRGSERFDVKAVIDPTCAGQDAGEVLDGIHRAIPIVNNLDEALHIAGPRVHWCVVGIATHGGHIDDDIRTLILEAISRKLSVVNGLHDACCDDEAIVAAALSSRRNTHRS